MKRPLAGIILGYAGGILLGHFCPLPPVALWCGTLAAGMLALWRGRFQTEPLWLMVILAGWANLASHTVIVSPNDLRTLLGNTPAAVSVRGILAEPTQVKIIERDGVQTEHSLTIVEVTRLGHNDQWSAAAGRVMVMTPGILDARFFPGREIEVSGAIGPPAPPLAEGLLDYREYLRNRGIYYQLKANATNDWQLATTGPEAAPATQRFLDWSRATMARGLPVEDEPLRLIWAMVLGWRTAFTGDIGDPFLRAGTMHLFAIDGLRIALVSGMLLTLLRVVRLSRAVCGLVCIPAIWFYTAATGWEPSAIRASVMMSIIIFGWVLKRPSDLLNSLAAAAFIILVWNPLQLFEAEFQLSFFVVLIIALMLPPLNEWIDRRLQFDPLVPDALIPQWRKLGVAGLRIFLKFLALSLAAWVGSIPLSAKYFHLFSPVSPLANVVAVPLGIFALMSNLGSLMCGAWLPWATILFNHSAWFFMLSMTQVSEWSCDLPGAYYYVVAPSWLEIGLYYLILVAGLTGWMFAPKRRIPAALVLAALAAIGTWHWHIARQNTELTVLPLSGNPVVFVEGAGARNQWLINCGNESATEFTLKPFLRAQGVNHVGQLILTTGDLGCSGGADQLNQIFGVKELFTSPAHFRSAPYREFAAEFDQRPGRHTLLQLNDTAGCWQMLHPGPTNDFSRADDNALVLCGQFYHSHILLLASLGREGQSALLARTNDLSADIVVTGLPAQGEPLCDDLIQAVHPKVIVIVDADFPVVRRANYKLKARLKATGIPAIYTRTAGAVTIMEGPAGWEVRTMDGRVYKSAD